MKPLKIYHNINQGSMFSLDDVIIEPEKIFSNESSESIYRSCPAWAHKAKRTFVIKSPVDVTFNVNKYGVITEPKEFEKFLELTKGWNSDSNVTLQWGELLLWLFWSDEKDVWIHSQPNLSTIKNNFYTVEAWFNISSWNRPISFAFNVIDRTKPVVIKRGDPLYSVSFYTKNLDRPIVLERREIPDKLHNDVVKRMSIRSLISMQPFVQKLMFKSESSTESKCPFSSLWKKK